MAHYTFRGGVHPFDGKAMSKSEPIKEVLPGKELVFPLSQHIGAPAKPVVEVGDHVLVGQMIAEAGGFVSAPIHSSVSGTYKGLEDRFVVTGSKVPCMIIENDDEYEEVDFGEFVEPDDLDKEEILKRIQKGGIVGMGGAGFPTHVKLSPKEPDKISYIIANCAECEPYLTSDYRCMMERPEWIVEGLRIILKLFPKAKGIIGIEDNKPDAITAIQKITADSKNIKIIPLKTKYPQGAERMLINACTGRTLNSSQLPADVGCVVCNCDTVFAICNAVTFSKPLIKRIVTVTGDCVKKPQNFEVCIGSNFADLVDEAGGFTKEPVKIISGGPMMGFGMWDMNVPVTKTSSALLCMSRDDISEKPATACINCGRCVSVCDENLVPSRLAKLAEHHNSEAFVKMGGMECCECGCCSYVCPAKRPLTQAIKSERRQILADRKKK